MRRFAAPALIALWIVGSAPFLGRLTRWVREEFDRSLLVVVPTILFWVAAAAFVVWVVRSARQLRWSNYAALAVGALWAVAQATALARGRPEESALERMHLVLYGLVALLLYRAFLRGGRSAIVAAFSAAVLASLVGVADEFVQWLVWPRVGDYYDCVLNASAGGCGVVFGAGLFGFDTRAPVPVERRTIAALWVVLAVTSWGLTDLTNLGHLIADPELGRFRSQYNAERLEQLNENRRARWAVKLPPTDFQPWHIEDHFLSEAAWHVQAPQRSLRRRRLVDRSGRAGDPEPLLPGRVGTGEARGHSALRLPPGKGPAPEAGRSSPGTDLRKPRRRQPDLDLAPLPRALPCSGRSPSRCVPCAGVAPKYLNTLDLITLASGCSRTTFSRPLGRRVRPAAPRLRRSPRGSPRSDRRRRRSGLPLRRGATGGRRWCPRRGSCGRTRLPCGCRVRPARRPRTRATPG